jgi:hypothetical protein
MNLTILKRLCWLLIILSLIPASILVFRRIQAEDSRITVTLLMDEVALSDQAQYLGISSLELAKRYQALGANGIAIYEETFESLSANGDIAVQLGSDIMDSALERGEAVPAALRENSDVMLISEIKPGALDDILASNPPEPKTLLYARRTWYIYPGKTWR